MIRIRWERGNGRGNLGCMKMRLDVGIPILDKTQGSNAGAMISLNAGSTGGHWAGELDHG
jgi:hypothetical protein